MVSESCAKCGAGAAPSACAACKMVRYCDKNCQRAHWATHKAACAPRAPAAAKSTPPFFSPIEPIDERRAENPADWARGLKPPELYEWLANCYEMRCDDDYVHGGCYLHGMLDPKKTRASIVRDFQVFCLLASRRGVLPSTWNWPAFLKVASKFAASAFEKSDAQERWGGENIFAAMTGGRSLRYTAECVYGSSCQEGEKPISGQMLALINKQPTVLDEIGGKQVWATFEAELQGV